MCQIQGLMTHMCREHVVEEGGAGLQSLLKLHILTALGASEKESGQQGKDELRDGRAVLRERVVGGENQEQVTGCSSGPL